MEFNELVDSLTKTGAATHPLEGSTVHAVRTRLIAAAQEANVRIAMKKKGDCIEARVLSKDEARAQRTRDTLLSGVNRIKTGLEILTTGAISTGEIQEEIDDLKEIVDYLEDYAKEIGGATR